MDFKFELGDEVTIAGGAECGKVIGRAEHLNSDNMYLVRYIAGDGRAVEAWWHEDALA